MQRDSRDEMWAVVYETWYDAGYNLEVATRMVDRTKATDDVTKVLVAVTASGSVVAGWALWSTEGFSIAWTCIAGFAALLSIVHGTLGIPA